MSADYAPNRWQRYLIALHRIEDALLALLLGAMILLATAQIVLRNVFEAGLTWADPLLRIMVLWIGLLGAMAASRAGKHISIDALSAIIPPRLVRWSRVATSLFTAAVCALVAWHAGRFVVQEYGTQNSAVFGLGVWCYELIIPLAFAAIALRYLILAAAQWTSRPPGHQG